MLPEGATLITAAAAKAVMLPGFEPRSLALLHALSPSDADGRARRYSYESAYKPCALGLPKPAARLLELVLQVLFGNIPFHGYFRLAAATVLLLLSAPPHAESHLAQRRSQLPQLRQDLHPPCQVCRRRDVSAPPDAWGLNAG